MAKRRRILAPGTAVIVSLLALAIASSVVHHAKKDDYAPFADCPLQDPHTDLCLFSRTEGGQLIAGSKTLPIGNTITLQGGVHVVQNSEREIVRDDFIAAKSGATLSRTVQLVPGGLRGVLDPELLSPALRHAYDGLVAKGSTEVTATIQLAAPASSIGIDVQNLIEARGIGLSLPLKIELRNPLLGASCYIGSNAHPIVIPLTTGRLASTRRAGLHGSIGGKPGHASFKDHYNLVTLTEDSLVSDSFATPRATGCGAIDPSSLDSAIDAELGLPAAAGHNSAILYGTLADANAPAVKASR